MLIYLHNICVKIETRGKLEPLAREYDARVVDIKFMLRVLAVVVVVEEDRYVRQAFDARLAMARLVSRYLTSVISSGAVLSDVHEAERTAT